MRRIFISFFLSILLLKYASSVDSECMATEELGDKQCAGLEPSTNYLCVDANEDNGKNGDKPCIEVETCNILLPDDSITEGDKCDGHKKLNKDNHCKEIIVNSEKKCKEVPACEGAKPAEGINYDNCKDLWTDDSSKKCVVADNEAACKVAENCGDVTKGANANVCGLFTTETSKCVVADNEEGCKVATKCDDVTKGANANVCGLFTTETSKCVVADNEEGCKVATKCDDVTKGANANVCDLFTTDSQICVLNEAACKVATKCDDVTTGANAKKCGLFTTETSKCVVADNGDECIPKTICGKENYEKGTTNCRESVTDDNKVCVDTGSNCDPQTHCEKVDYKTSPDCTIFPTVGPNKICRKH